MAERKQAESYFLAAVDRLTGFEGALGGIESVGHWNLGCMAPGYKPESEEH